ncbi:MAG: hypothetical protein AMXMBFR53_25050 [Gemmatimonadota bacterium]
MFDSTLLGATLAWHPLDDPPGAWGLTGGDQLLGEFAWSSGDSAVRAELDTEVWRVRVGGTLLVRAAATPAGAPEPALVYAGSLQEGWAVDREGARFALVAHFDAAVGPWRGVDDAGGAGILRARGRVGGGGTWWELSVAPATPHRHRIGGLLVLWGALQVLRARRPWLGLTASLFAKMLAERELGRLTDPAEP